MNKNPETVTLYAVRDTAIREVESRTNTLLGFPNTNLVHYALSYADAEALFDDIKANTIRSHVPIDKDDYIKEVTAVAIHNGGRRMYYPIIIEPIPEEDIIRAKYDQKQELRSILDDIKGLGLDPSKIELLTNAIK